MKNTGYIPSTYDGRDWEFDSSSKNRSREVLLHNPRPVINQGRQVLCCTSAAITGAMEALDAKQGDFCHLSVLFHYYNARGGSYRMKGIELRDALKAAVKPGVCRLKLHDKAMTRKGARKKPSRAAVANAKKQAIVAFDARTFTYGYWRIKNSVRLRKCKEALRDGAPIVAGFWMTSDYEKIRKGLADTLQLAQPEPSGHAHAVALLGFSEKRKAFQVRDSFGERLGDKGYWWLPFAVLESDLFNELWVIDKISYD